MSNVKMIPPAVLDPVFELWMPAFPCLANKAVSSGLLNKRCFFSLYSSSISYCQRILNFDQSRKTVLLSGRVCVTFSRSRFQPLVGGIRPWRLYGDTENHLSRFTPCQCLRPYNMALKSAMASEIFSCWGHTASQLRQPMQALGCLSAGMAESAIGAIKPPPVNRCSL